jgi:cell division protein FtsI/penicillin-binding protein 2
MAAEVAVDGRALRPHVVQEVRGGEDARSRRPLQPGFIASPVNWAALHRGMELVVAEGTGAAARVPGVAVAGKTGTAQNPHGDDHALFVGVAPIDAPRLVVVVVVEASGHGGTYAAPVAQQVMEVFLKGKKKKTPEGDAAVPPGVEAAASGRDAEGD